MYRALLCYCIGEGACTGLFFVIVQVRSMYRALLCYCTGEGACTGLFFVIAQVREHVPGSPLLLYR